jgi:nicotinamidase-related amidase
MTHMCVNSTARGAFNLGYAPTAVANATATRALPGTTAAVSPATLQAASLAALGDRRQGYDRGHGETHRRGATTP